jgi:hypothetical protein
LGLAESACAKQAPSPAPVTPPNPRVVAGGKVLDYLPAAGLRWLVVGSPSRLAADPELARSLALVVPPERLDAFAHATGIRLDRLSMGAIAGYDLGTLYIGELDGPEAPVVRSRFSAGLVEGGVVRGRKGVHRIVGTTSSGSVRALVTVDDRYIAFASGDATLARIVEAYAENRLRSPTVLRGAGLRELPALSGEALGAFLAPGPFSGEWAGAAGGIVAAALAASIEITKAAGERLHAKLTLTGSWDEGAAKALEKLELAWSDLATSPTGRLLGLDGATAIKGSADLQRLTFVADLPVGPLARGLRDATSADVREILDLGGPRPGSSP